MSYNRWQQPPGARGRFYDNDRGTDRNVRHRGPYPSHDRWNGYSSRSRHSDADGQSVRRPSRSGDNERHSRAVPEKTQTAFNVAEVEVTVNNMAGISLLGPEKFSSSTSVACLKDRLRKSRPGTGVRLIHDTVELVDHDLIGKCLSEAACDIKLTAILSKTYAVAAWGESTYGGNVHGLSLEDGVIDLFGSSGAFCAIKEGGAVVAWGHGAYGGDCSRASRQLSSDVTSICVGQNAFVALKKDGSAVAWGNAHLGGKVPPAVNKSLASGVTAVQSSGEAFAALKGSPGHVVTWGQAISGGDSSAVASQLASGVKEVFSSRGAFAALKEGGSVVTWGNHHCGGDSSRVAQHLDSGVVKVVSNCTSFAALKEGGMVVTWGNSACGGIVGPSAEKLSSGVTEIYSSGSAFAAVKADGTLVSWGQAGQPTVSAEILARGGKAVKTTGRSVAMVLETGEVLTDGDAAGGGDSSSVAAKLASGVASLASTQGAFAALKDDGSVITWGRSKPVNVGGDSSSVASSLQRGVVKVHGTQGAFAALHEVAA